MGRSRYAFDRIDLWVQPDQHPFRDAPDETLVGKTNRSRLMAGNYAKLSLGYLQQLSIRVGLTCRFHSDIASTGCDTSLSRVPPTSRSLGHSEAQRAAMRRGSD